MIYKCLECKTQSSNYYYIKKHKHKNIEAYCSFCNQLYFKGHYGRCVGIAINILLS